ncbi:hypothetical protein LOTGIDRAFT_235510 [Lottia gigantea]|uniref:Major facilitator superfamily (MFS) profile domain-containing protein n=1 Tax=Lottia gigantea TaxID=225164 RepID=V3ZYR9_LOTGI|nr:hypothetical protein LOTGIDRAFT_235510 [Lottia gigantea]ESO86136.1 hypothetical protein LOTGIDRAFT_235510 [Lottia gigantea]
MSATEESRPILPPIFEDDDGYLVGPLRGSKPKAWVLGTVLTFFFISHGIAIPTEYYYAEYYLKKKYGPPEHTDTSVKYYTSDGYNGYYNLQSNLDQNTTDLMNKAMTTFLVYNKVCDGLGIIPALLIGPVIDSVGRRIGLILPTVGILIKAILFYLFIFFDLNMYFILIGCLVETVSGGWVVMVLSCLGIFADSTPPGEERSFKFTVVEGIQVIGISASIILTTYWIDQFEEDMSSPMIIAMLFAVLPLIIVLSLVPETLDHTVSFTCSLQTLTRCAKIYKNTDHYPKRKWIMFALLVCIILESSVGFTKSNIQQLVLRYDPHFKWSRTKISFYVSLSLIICWVVVLITTKLLQRFLKLEDLSFAILGGISLLTSLLMFSIAAADAMAYGAVAAGTLAYMIPPMIKSFASKHVLLREQGSLFAGFAAFKIGISSIMGGVIEYIYRETASIYRGFPSQIMALFTLIVIILLIILKVKTRSEVRYGYQRLPEDQNPFEREQS